MVSYMAMKKELQKDILLALGRVVSADLTKLLAEFSLKSGFTERSISKVLSQMAELGYITIDGNIVKIGTQKSNEEVKL